MRRARANGPCADYPSRDHKGAPWDADARGTASHGRKRGDEMDLVAFFSPARRRRCIEHEGWLEWDCLTG